MLVVSTVYGPIFSTNCFFPGSLITFARLRCTVTPVSISWLKSFPGYGTSSEVTTQDFIDPVLTDIVRNTRFLCHDRNSIYFLSDGIFSTSDERNTCNYILCIVIFFNCFDDALDDIFTRCNQKGAFSLVARLFLL